MGVRLAKGVGGDAQEKKGFKPPAIEPFFIK
jgi:hypothetical protein